MEDRRKILLVDDVELFRELQKTFFHRRDVDLVVAEDGKEAYRQALRHRPDLIFMDLHMPQMDGDECCVKIKEHDQLGNIPVVMVTSGMREDDIERCKAAGCDAIVPKPINRQNFLETANNFLQMPIRIAPRVRVGFAVSYGPPGQAIRHDEAFNISSGGVFIKTHEFFEVDTPLHVEFKLPNREQTVNCPGRVAWINKPEAGGRRDVPSGMGVQFVGIDLDSLSALREFINAELDEVA